MEKTLNENYNFWQEMECPPENKLEYIGEVIFDFTTYENIVLEKLTKEMFAVIEAILNKRNFAYIENEENEEQYLRMVNYPFLYDKLEWGTSIRGAWFDDYKEYRIDCDRIIIKKGELTNFLKDLIIWSKN